MRRWRYASRVSVKLDKLTKALREAIDELRAEQASIDAKIRALAESAKALGGAVGRGRKAAAAGEGGAPGRKKPKWSPEARAAAAERARLRKAAGVTNAAFDMAWMGRLNNPGDRARLWAAIGLFPAGPASV